MNIVVGTVLWIVFCFVVIVVQSCVVDDDQPPSDQDWPYPWEE